MNIPIQTKTLVPIGKASGRLNEFWGAGGCYVGKQITNAPVVFTNKKQ